MPLVTETLRLTSTAGQDPRLWTCLNAHGSNEEPPPPPRFMTAGAT